MKVRTGMSFALVQRQQIRQATISARIGMAKAKRIKTSKNSSKNLSKSKLTSDSTRTLLGSKLNAALAAQGMTQVDLTVEEKTKSYKQMKQMALNLQQYGAEFLEEGEKSLFEGDTSQVKLQKELLASLSDFNDMMDCMNDVDSTTMNLYIRQLKQYEISSSQSLEKVGISIESDGTLTVQSEKFKAADKEDLKKVFHEKGSFFAQVANKSKNIRANAEYCLSNLNLVYGSSIYQKNGTTSMLGGSTYNARS